jgi:hypothetical protein
MRKHLSQKTRQRVNVGTFLLPSLDLVRLFHPRLDNWEEHFDLSESLIITKTDIGKATIKILQFNHPNRLIERTALISANLFPPPDSLLNFED